MISHSSPNQYYADLHIHSTCSDGLLTPLDIVEICAELQLATIAITDHDSVAAVEQAIAADKKELEIIPAVEMSANIDNLDVHILAYYIDYENSDLQSYLMELREYRFKRAKKIVDKLSHDGIKLDFDRMREIAKNAVLGRPHIAEALRQQGYVDSIREAFVRYLSYHSPYYEPKKNICPEDLIKKIKDWCGIPVIAHPGILNDEDLIYQLIGSGVLGIEVWHPEHSSLLQQRLYEIALKNQLLMTGGSDCHGYRGSHVQIGTCGCGEKEVQLLREYRKL